MSQPMTITYQQIQETTDILIERARTAIQNGTMKVSIADYMRLVQVWLANQPEHPAHVSWQDDFDEWEDSDCPLEKF